jgi:HEAT repeat protein
MLSDTDFDYYLAQVGHGDDDIHYHALETLLEHERTVVPRLSECLRTGPSSSTRWRCATVLVRMNHPDVEAALLHALENEADPSVREVAIAGLSHLTDPAHTPVFLKSLRDPSEVVRRWSATILGHLGDAASIEPLLQALEDQDEWTAFRAANGLRFAECPKARAKLAQLRDHARDDAVKRSALQALWEWDHPK